MGFLTVKADREPQNGNGDGCVRASGVNGTYTLGRWMCEAKNFTLG